jgi:penicillin-binding protein-related factor A (putative recombinase)
MTSASDRGKEGEGLLKKYLDTLCRYSDTAYYRLPDARAGSMRATLADFLLMRKGVLHLIECKEVKHDFRLPHGNFDKAQVARQRLWKDAGANSLVLVYHSTLGKWRGYDIERFIDRSEGGSWDLRDTIPKTLPELLC